VTALAASTADLARGRFRLTSLATGLVQEFPFGMTWLTYSEFVGGVFGAPLPSWSDDAQPPVGWDLL
jgi:hypothetical protein